MTTEIIDRRARATVPAKPTPQVATESRVAVGVEAVDLQIAEVEAAYKLEMDGLRQKKTDEAKLQYPLSALIQKYSAHKETTGQVERDLALQEKLSAEYRPFLEGILTAPDETQGQHLYRIANLHPGYVWADHFIIEIKKVLAKRELERIELEAQIKTCLHDGRKHLAHLLPGELKHLAQ